jgi:hypothetical protein
VTWLVILAAVVALLAMPTDAKIKGPASPELAGAWARTVLGAYAAWAVVCVAMVTGLVTWAVLR